MGGQRGRERQQMKADVADMMVERRFTAKWLAPSPLQKTKSSGTGKKDFGDDVTYNSPPAKECLPECLLLSLDHDKLGLEEAG
jgi:hypothetical protein